MAVNNIMFNPNAVGIFAGEEIECVEVHLQKFEDLIPDGITERQKAIYLRATLAPNVFKKVVMKDLTTYDEIKKYLKDTFTAGVNPTVLYNNFGDLTMGI